MDLFEREQQIYNEAEAHLKGIQAGAPCGPKQFALLTAEYGNLLNQFRKIIRWSDKTTTGLITDKIDLQHLSLRDALTGIYNRRFMEESLERYVAFLSAAGGTLSVLMIDIDFFKKYNDAYGRGQGDICLKSVAAALADGISREGSFAARYGEDEFIAVLSGADENNAVLVADRLLERVRELRLPHAAGDAAGFVTISIGIATGVVDGKSRAGDYVKRAEEALSISKLHGRNRLTCFGVREEPQ